MKIGFVFMDDSSENEFGQEDESPNVLLILFLFGRNGFERGKCSDVPEFTKEPCSNAT